MDVNLNNFQFVLFSTIVPFKLLAKHEVSRQPNVSLENRFVLLFPSFFGSF